MVKQHEVKGMWTETEIETKAATDSEQSRIKHARNGSSVGLL